MPPHPAATEVMRLAGIPKLNPMQEQSLAAGLLGQKNMVIAAPTASGKTLLAEMAALKAVMEKKKAFYIVPLRALASEKYEEFKERYAPLGIKVGLSMGDLDASDAHLQNFDIIVLTSEKLDSLLRHGIPWLQEVGLVIADEIHLLDDPGRGPTLEIILTKLRQLANPRILALSATIQNYQEIADWLDATAVFSEFRPVKLYSGVYFSGELHCVPERQKQIGGKDPLESLVADTIHHKKQAIVFVNTRKGTESAALKLSEVVEQHLSPEEKERLQKIAGSIEHSLDHTTTQCAKLADCIRSGTAFHHAGLVNEQRKKVEAAFKEGLIKVITATPTLAAGINMPAYRVIIRDLKRFGLGGMDYLPVLEIRQMLGRAGRPKYDTEGEGILLPKSEAEARFAWDTYINGETEEISSKLGAEPALRTHILGLVASGLAGSREELMSFFSKTFYAHKYGNLAGIEMIVDKILSQLRTFSFVDVVGDVPEGNPFRKASSLRDVDLHATPVGKRVAELYLDPLTAHHLIQCLSRADKASAFTLLQTVANTIEMRPPMSVKKADREEINQLLVAEGKNLLGAVPEEWDSEYDDFMGSLKTAHVIHNWIQETGEDRLLESYSVSPGELRMRLDIADWLLYSSCELSVLLKKFELLKDLRKLRIRVRYGIKEELLPLVRLRGVGRVRARKLWAANLRSIDQLRKAPLPALARLIGDKVAESVKQQLGEDNNNLTIGN